MCSVCIRYDSDILSPNSPHSQEYSRSAHNRVRSPKMKSFALTLVAAASLATAAQAKRAVDLLPHNFDSEMDASSAAFVKFLAPW